MAADPDLVDRLRAWFGGEVHEKAMFGGVAFLVGGHMTVAAGSNGGLMVRCDPDDLAAFCEEPGVEPMVMRGSPMKGWLTVEAPIDDDALGRWATVGRHYVASLPPK